MRKCIAKLVASPSERLHNMATKGADAAYLWIFLQSLHRDPLWMSEFVETAGGLRLDSASIGPIWSLIGGMVSHNI